MKGLPWYITINAIFLFLACRGIYTSLFMNSVNRSLWIDEAFLASSFSKRSFWGIFIDGEFEYLQSAPLGWLWLVKILTILFGNTPYVLRTGSVLGFILILIFLTLIQLLFYESKFPFAAAAILSNVPVVLQYSNMFKPYITDGTVVLAITLVYGLWRKEKIDWKLLTFLWMCMIWFSQTACFMIGGFLLCELLFSCLHKEKKAILQTIIIGLLVVLSFSIYFFVWIRRMTSVTGMQNYWNSFFFPFPKSVSDLKYGLQLINSIFRRFDHAYMIVLAFSVSGVVLSVLEKDRILISLFFGTAIAVFASLIHMYPIIDRLWCFSYPVFTLIACITLEKIAQRRRVFEFITAFVLVIVAINNTGFETYSRASNVYMYNQELQMEIDYLFDHMKKDDKVYVYSFSKPGFEYINGYDNKSFGKGTNNVIIGDADFDWTFQFDYKSEIEKILSNSNMWIVSSHTDDVFSKRMLSKLVDAMHENGYLELVYNPYGTPLWYYSKSLDDVKKHFTMSIQNVISGDRWNEAVIRIKNDGEAYINNPYENIYIIEKNTGTVYPIDGLIAPGEERDITVRFTPDEVPEYTLRSCLGQIAKDDSITITRDMMGDK